MKTITATLLAVSFACVAATAAAQQPAQTTVPQRVWPSLQTVKLYAGIPMVYKKYALPGVNAPGGKSSWTAQRSSTVIIQNVAATPTDVTLCMYPSVLDQFTLPPSQVASVCTGMEAIPPGASWRLKLDDLPFLDDGFHGSAVVSGGQPVTAVATHEFVDGDIFAISMTSAVKAALAGADAYVPSLYWDADGALGTHAMSTLFAQNLDSVDNDLTVKLFRAGESAPVHTAVFHLAPGRAAQLDVPNVLANSLLSNFNGSATVRATRADASEGQVGVHVFELAAGRDSAIYNQAKAYVGFTGGALRVNMATALCEAFGQNTAYAIQNISPDPAHVSVVFNPGFVSHDLDIPGYSKASLQTCAVMQSGFSGSATIDSNQPIVAIGKAFVAGQLPGRGTSTAFEGVESGANRLSIPLVNWSSNFGYLLGEPRSNIAVQNVGNADVDGVIARYFTTTGSYQDISLGKIAKGAKVNTSVDGLADPVTRVPSAVENAIVSDGIGSVEIIGPASSSLSALVRVQRRQPRLFGATFAEDSMAAQQNAKWHCRCKVTPPSAAPLFKRPFNRARDGASVVGICAAANARKGGFYDGAVHGEGYGSNCEECGQICRSNVDRQSNSPIKKSALALYYLATFVVPALGTPPKPPHADYGAWLEEDLIDLILQDPCKAQSFAFEFDEKSCKQAN